MKKILSELKPDVRARVEEALKTTLERELMGNMQCITGDLNMTSSGQTRNHVNGLSKFIADWDQRTITPEGEKDHLYKKSELGNINSKGSSDCYHSYIFTRWDPQFEHSLEEGVKKLVLRLIDELNCITYSSCEGHMPVNAPSQFRERHVGIVPRDALECRIYLQKLNRVATLVNQDTEGKNVAVKIKKDIVTTESNDMECVDVLFLPKTSDLIGYFEDLEYVYDLFLKHLK